MSCLLAGGGSEHSKHGRINNFLTQLAGSFNASLMPHKVIIKYEYDLIISRLSVFKKTDVTSSCHRSNRNHFRILRSNTDWEKNYQNPSQCCYEWVSNIFLLNTGYQLEQYEQSSNSGSLTQPANRNTTALTGSWCKLKKVYVN